MYSPRGSKYALVAPFKRHDLPKDNILSLFRDKGFDVQVCTVKAADEHDKKRIEDECKTITKAEISKFTPIGGGIISRSFAI